MFFIDLFIIDGSSVYLHRGQVNKALHLILAGKFQGAPRSVHSGKNRFHRLFDKGPAGCLARRVDHVVDFAVSLLCVQGCNIADQVSEIAAGKALEEAVCLLSVPDTGDDMDLFFGVLSGSVLQEHPGQSLPDQTGRAGNEDSLSTELLQEGEFQCPFNIFYKNSIRNSIRCSSFHCSIFRQIHNDLLKMCPGFRHANKRGDKAAFIHLPASGTREPDPKGKGRNPQGFRPENQNHSGACKHTLHNQIIPCRFFRNHKIPENYSASSLSL